MHLQSEKVTCTCSQRFAELDPDCFNMVLAPWRQRELRRWRRGLPDEPDLASTLSTNIAARVHLESGRLNWTVTDYQDVCDDHAVGAVGSQ